MRPLAIDLFCGLGGWTEALMAEGYFVVGFDIERHEYGEHRFPGHLVLQDVLTLHGSQFKDAALIVASPPCQEYSYMAMPWKLAKAKAAAIRADTTGAELERLNRLFDACFRIQREACEAAGKHIPLIVENVRGAIPWVGRSRWNFGSFHLWGDVPALMPIPLMRKIAVKKTIHKGDGSVLANIVVGEGVKRAHGTSGSHWTNPAERDIRLADISGFKSRGMNWSDKSLRGQDFTRIAGKQAMVAEGRKGAGAGAEWFDKNLCQFPSASPSRKAASAMIAKIPAPLARHIAKAFHPGNAGRSLCQGNAAA